MKINNFFGIIVCIGLILASCAPMPNTSEPRIEEEQENITENKLPQGDSISTDEPFVSGEAGEFIFDPTNVNTTLPEDINDVVEEIVYYGRGGGSDQEDPCVGIDSPTIISEWFDIEQLERAWVVSCGWDKDQEIRITPISPSGQDVPAEKLGSYGSNWQSDFGLLYWSYLPTAFDETGEYHVNFSNGVQTLEYGFKVSRITKSGATLFGFDDEIQVYNFASNEKIRMFVYSSRHETLKFEGWKSFTVAPDGKLLIKLLQPDQQYLNYAIVGEQTGEFHLTDGFAESILRANTPVLSNTPLCTGAPLSQVGVGSTARVTFTDGTPTRIRKSPTTSSDIVGRLPEGTRFLIIGGHKCNDGYTWWQIEIPNGSRGWMAEGKGGTYYLEPMSFAQQTCSETVSRLSVGDQAQVARVDGSNTRLRSQPGFTQSIVGKVPEGTPLTILDGPECIDGNNWWYVRTNNGLEGWMTESQNGVYLIEPSN